MMVGGQSPTYVATEAESRQGDDIHVHEWNHYTTTIGLHQPKRTLYQDGFGMTVPSRMSNYTDTATFESARQKGPAGGEGA
jgi:hypothetical protein